MHLRRDENHVFEDFNFRFGRLANLISVFPIDAY